MRLEMIETERVIIREFRPEDAEDLYEYLSLNETYTFEPGEPVTLEKAREIAIERSMGNDFLAVVRKQDHKMIGHLYFSRVDPKRFLTWELGYIFNPRYQRQGYASEAAGALIDHAFRNTNLHRVMARCSVENTASWKLLERIDFTREGTFREHGFLRRDDRGNPLWNDVYEYSRLSKASDE